MIIRHSDVETKIPEKLFGGTNGVPVEQLLLDYLNGCSRASRKLKPFVRYREASQVLLQLLSPKDRTRFVIYAIEYLGGNFEEPQMTNQDSLEYGWLSYWSQTLQINWNMAKQWLAGETDKNGIEMTIPFALNML